jgi:hypothetical protein
VTEFSKTFLVFYKWLNLTDVQFIVHSKVCLVIFVCCEHAPWYFYHFLVLQVNRILLQVNRPGFKTKVGETAKRRTEKRLKRDGSV